MIQIKRTDDLEEAARLHDKAFPDDGWPGDDHTFWIAYDGEKPVGFASAIYREETRQVFFSRAAVIKRARGNLLHVRLIKHRLMWSIMRGAQDIVTYTTLQNYPSMVNLLACGFKFYKPVAPWVGKRVHYFRYVIEGTDHAREEHKNA